METKQLWKVTYSKQPPKSETFYIIAEQFTGAVALAISCIKMVHPLDAETMTEQWESVSGMLIEKVDTLVDPDRSVEIRHYDVIAK